MLCHPILKEGKSAQCESQHGLLGNFKDWITSMIGLEVLSDRGGADNSLTVKVDAFIINTIP